MKALIVVDIQNDYLPGGACAVPGGEEIIPLVNRLMPAFEVVVATQDWHPWDHGSFAESHSGCAVGEIIDLHGLQQTLGPAHCVQGSKGAKFAPDLKADLFNYAIRKGTDRTVDSYSGFFDKDKRHDTGLAGFLRGKGVDEVVIAGLATDDCVKFTALDAVELEFKTAVITDACRGLNLQEGDTDRALVEMKAKGVALLDSAAFLKG